MSWLNVREIKWFFRGYGYLFRNLNGVFLYFWYSGSCSYEGDILDFVFKEYFFELGWVLEGRGYRLG